MNTLGGLVISLLVITMVILIISKQLTAEELLCADQEFYFEFPNALPNVNIDRDTDIEGFTICLWLSTTTVSNLGILRFTDQSTSNVHVALSLSSFGYLFFSLFGEDRQLQVLPDVQVGNWHGLCVTWQKEDGFFMVYYDGRLLLNGTDFKTGQLASFKGIFTLGIGVKGFLYTGSLSHVNAWSSVLNHPQLALLSSKCGVERGELVSWPEFKQGAYGVSVIEGVPCPFTETDITNELKHWRLDGSDDELSPRYSASFVEGRLDDHKAAYLDQTMAYIEAPFVDLGTTFTIACWVKLLPSNPYLKPILFSENGGTSNGRFWFGIDADNKLLFENSITITSFRKEVDEPLHEKLWLHVAVSLTTSNELLFYINGLKHLSSSISWQSPSTGPFAIGQFYITSESKYVYFHGFLSDLYLFSRALSAEEIGQIMGRSLPCTFSEWSSHPMLTPGQNPTENRRTKTCPGVGQCNEVRAWKPADCREALLAGNKTSGVYTISPLNNEDEFDVFCDQETQGGGWTVIQQRNDGSLSFYKTWDEYKNGFGTIGSQSEMWLGNDKIHSLTTKNTELLIQLEAFDGRKGFAMYSDFHVAGENDYYRLSLGNFSGNLLNKLETHSGATFRVDNCVDVQDVGWWFTPSCGEVLLNSQYGQNTGVMKWGDFPNSGDAGGTLMKTSMKIRRTKGYSGDYTLIFRKSRSETSMIFWRTILTEFKAFTLCLWHKLYVQEDSGKLTMTLLRYFTEDGNFTLIIKDFNGDGGPTLSLIIWPSSEKQRTGVQFPAPDGSWHHLCVLWTNNGGVATTYMDGTLTYFPERVGDGVEFIGGGKLLFGAVQAKTSNQLEGEVSYVNLWDTVLSEASIQSIMHSCQTETGNLLQWSFFAAMAVGTVEYVPSSSCTSKEMYHWNFDHSGTTESIDLNENHVAKLTETRISADQQSLVIEDQGYFVAENISSDLNNDQGFTVSFSVRQTVMSSDILKDDFQSLEELRSAFPAFIRDYAMWKRCYSADHSSWSTAEFHSNCDFKGPSLTIIRVREYVFGGFVEQSWGGTPQDIGHQFEAFLFSLSDPSGKSSRFFPIQQGKTSARTDPQLGPSFGQRDLELFEDDTGRLMGFSGLGASFNVTNMSLSSSESRNFFAGSQRFYPDQVEVFYCHLPSTPVGLEEHLIPDDNFYSSSVSDADALPHLARLNDMRHLLGWCSSGATASEWLQVSLDKQYTLTHIAVQSVIGGGHDVTALTVKYENTQEGENWMTYSKLVDGTETSKVIQFNLLSMNIGTVVKEAFVPPFQASKLQITLTEQKVLCLKMELYFYDAGCSLAHGIEDGTIPNQRLTASSSDETKTNTNFWPFRGRLNNNAASRTWGPYKRSGEAGTVGDWFQVDLQQQQEVKCIATQGRETNVQWVTNYQIAYSSEGNDWKFYEQSNGEVKEFDANSDQHLAVSNWFVPSFYGRFIRVYVTGINNYCRLRLELYGKRTNLTEIYSFQNGLAFTVRRGRYHIFFGKDSYFWEIHHPLIVNQWFDATLTWTPDDGLKFYVNGMLVASDTTPEPLNLPLASEPFKLIIGLAENGSGWSRAILIDEVKVWKMALEEEEIKRQSEVYLDFDDNSRDWALLLNASSGWELSHGCTETAGTGPCDDVSGGGRYILFDASQPVETARFVTPSNITSYLCLKFHYHMAGAHVGRLNVYSTGLYGNEELLWRLFGDQNDTWNEAHVPVNVIHPQYQVIFEAIKGSNYLGDIAIDEIKFTREECSLLPSSAAPQDLLLSGVVIYSSIVPMDSVYHQYLSLMLKEEGHDSSRWTPCYRALHDSWSVSTFHQKCDNKGPTLSIVRKDNFVFGGFTERSWGEDEVDSNFEVDFWRQDVNDYVWADSSSSISQFTASMWIKNSGVYPFTLFSFGTVPIKIQFYMQSSDRTNLCIWENSYRRCSLITLAPPYPNDGSWRHLTVTWWDSEKWTLFLDGQLLGNGIQSTWYSFSNIPVGTLWIGQNQQPINTPTGSFQGQITAFNMWDFKMTDSEIAILAQSCLNIPGNVFRWKTFRNNVHGALNLVRPSSCQKSINPSYDLHFWRQNRDDYVRSSSSSALSMNSFTVSFWVMSSLQSSQIVFSFLSLGTVVEFEINNSGAPGICFVVGSNQAAADCSFIDSPSSKLNDGFWHQIVAFWSGLDKSWIVSIDGVSQGWTPHPTWTIDSIIAAGTLMIGQLPPSLSADSSKSFLGRITLFNMWDEPLDTSKLAMLARGCRNDPGDLFSWSALSNAAINGELKIIEPSSSCSTYYRSDAKAFIFSLNYTSEGSLFKKKISEQSAATAIYSSPSTGPTFGQAPFDFQIGDADNMKTGFSHHVVSYVGDGDVAESNLDTVLAGASTFDPSDVEVLYKVHGGTLCPQQCPFNHYCDEISGGCRCNTEDDNPVRCQIFQLYNDSSHFWPLDSEYEIKDLSTPGWGRANGGVYEVFGMMTDGVDGEIQLNHEGDTCATKSANYSCEDNGFTVSLFIKPENREDGRRQTFFKSLGKFVVYQEANTKSLIVRIQRATEYCLKEIAMPEKIWSHLAFTYNARTPKTLTVYRNGQRIVNFIRDEGCNMEGVPEFSSPSVSLSAGDGVFAKATYFDVAIWKEVLPEERIAQMFETTKRSVPFSVQVVARIENIPWHEDLTSPETETYRLITNGIRSNVTSFYSNYSGIQVTVIMNGYWSGSVIADFTITFNNSNLELIEALNQSVSSTGFLYNMPLMLQQLTPRNVPYEPPPNVIAASVSDTYMNITWDHPSLSPEIWNIFQGYEVYIRRAGTTQINVTQVNEPVNSVTLTELEPLVTYEVSVAAYTLTGVGKKSETIAVNTTFVAAPENISVVSVTYSCAIIHWNDVPPERYGLFVGYVVPYDFVYQSSFSMYKQTSPGSIHEVEICGLQPSSTYKYYVRRLLLESKLGNESSVQLFTTLEAPIRIPPTNVTARNTSSTTIMVQWQAPAIPVGVKLSGYEVFFKPRLNASAQWETTIACNSTSNVTLKSLQKYTEYEIMVTAFNILGPGNFSEVATAFTDEDIPLVGPVIISANYTSSTSINISWSPVPEPSRLGIITKYIFILTDVLTGEVTTAEFDGANLHGEVTNLSKYREYSITGAAANNKGQSNFTSTVTCRTDEDAPDLPPANVTAYNASSTAITIEFQAYSPEQLNGILRKYIFRIFKANVLNSPVRNYTFTIHRSRRRRAASNDSVVQKTLTGLEEYTMYSVQASFFTVKRGPLSAVVNVSTDEGVPRAPPLQVTAFNTSNSSILVTWQDITSSSVPGILLGYVLRIIKADDTNSSNFREIEHDSSTNKTITNLEAYTLYKISVAGYTRVGIGNFSETQSWTDEGVPLGPPNNLTGSSSSSSSISLYWLPVKKDLRKGIIQGHEAKIYDDNGTLLDETTVYGYSLSAYFDGLNVYSNYSVQVRAFTRKGFGPWSPLFRVSTGAPLPDKTPMNATARATGPYTIHVTWSAISVVDARSFFGYRVLYFPVSNPRQLKDIIVGRNHIQATIIGLRPFTLYGVQIAAYSTEDGNYTTPVYSQTWQAAPSAPPSRFGVSALDSQSLLVYWLDVPPEHRNGIIRGYRLAYTSSSNGTNPVITKRDYSEVLTQLQRATKYAIEVWAFNDAGDGVPASKTTWTGEDVPSRPPSNITAQNRTSLTSIPIFWEPFPQEYTHGHLVGYRVTHQAVSIGDLAVDFEPVISRDVGKAVTSMTLRNLRSLVVYRITVAAISNKGPGPAGVTFGETCRCRPHLKTNWRNYPPYVNISSLSSPGIIIPKLLTGVISKCCGECLAHGQSKLDFTRNGNNGIAQQNSSEGFLQNIDGQTDFSFPVIGYKLQDSYKGGLGYAPFVESAGVAFVVYTDTSGVKDAMFDALIACWPVVVIPLVMAYIAGVLVWLLDANSNRQHFPISFIHGTWEGIWWSFVSMTTVGYGDRTPISHLGRIFAVGWVLVGLVIISVTMGALTTALTTITSVSDTRIYGSKIGAVQGSPEYNLGVRRNALMNEAKPYHSLEELSEALLSREVEGILIDAYAGGTQKHLFSKPSVRVARVIDHQTAYGVVIGGDSMRLRHCFYGYMRSHQAEIFKWVEELVEPIKGSGLSDEEIVQDISTGLFDSDADLFHNALFITSICAVTGVVLGLFYEVVRRIRERQKVQYDNTLLTQKDKMIEEMRSIVEDFFQNAIKSLKKTKTKHKRELLKYAKCAPAKSEKRTSTITNSSFIHSKNNLNDDDISVIDLEDLRLNSAKC